MSRREAHPLRGAPIHPCCGVDAEGEVSSERSAGRGPAEAVTPRPSPPRTPPARSVLDRSVLQEWGSAGRELVLRARGILSADASAHAGVCPGV